MSKDYHFIWESLVKEGELKQAELVSKEYLSLLLKKRCVKRALDFIEEIKKVRKLSSEIVFFQTKFLILLGDSKELNLFFTDLYPEYIQGKTTLYNKYLEIIQSFQSDGVGWISHKVEFKFRIIRYFKSPKRTTRKNRLKVIKDFLYALYNYPEDLDFLFLFVEYCLINKRKKLSQKIMNYLSKASVDQTKYDSYLEKIELLPEDSDELITTASNRNNAQDLFSVDSKSIEVKRILSEIEDAIRNKNTFIEKALKQELKNIDKDNTVFFDTKESQNTTDTNENIAKKFLDNESNYHDRHDEFFRENEKAAEVFIKSHSDEELFGPYKDLVIMLNQMRMFRASLRVFSIVENLINPNDYLEEADFLYLKIETLISYHKYYLALNLIDDVLFRLPLLEKEKKCYWYLKAEVFRKLSKPFEAKAYYEKVYKNDMHYRLVRARLSEIEKN